MAPSRFMKKSINTSSEDIFSSEKSSGKSSLSLHVNCEDKDKLEEK